MDGEDGLAYPKNVREQNPDQGPADKAREQGPPDKGRATVGVSACQHGGRREEDEEEGTKTQAPACHARIGKKPRSQDVAQGVSPREEIADNGRVKRGNPESDPSQQGHVGRGKERKEGGGREDHRAPTARDGAREEAAQKGGERGEEGENHQEGMARRRAQTTPSTQVAPAKEEGGRPRAQTEEDGEGQGGVEREGRGGREGGREDLCVVGVEPGVEAKEAVGPYSQTHVEGKEEGAEDGRERTKRLDFPKRVQGDEEEEATGQAEKAEERGLAGGQEGRRERVPRGDGGTEARDSLSEALGRNAEEPRRPWESQA